MRRAPRVVVLVALLLPAGSSPAGAQARWLAGYAQTVPIWTGSTAVTDSNVGDSSRFRLTSELVLGELSLEAAYEHAAALRRRRSLSRLGVGAVPGGGEYLDLQWTITDAEQVRWEHRFDRLNVGWSPTGALEVSAGRQAVSWGTTLFLTPADPFIPFNPADPFREFRAGVDAARLRIYPGPLSEVDVVMRVTKTDVGEEITALARGLATWRNWELSGWGGSLYGDVAGAFAAVGSVGAWAVRGEAVVRALDDNTVVRGTVGLDHLQQLRGRDLYFIFEYQHDGLAASSVDEYLEVLLSAPFRRGELQVLGRNETVVQASYQLHPLWSLSGLWLWNLNDRSALLAPSIGYSASDDTSIAGGVYVGLGDDASSLARPLSSEYGLAGTTAYMSVSWYF